jgi:hypothetical protein
MLLAVAVAGAANASVTLHQLFEQIRSDYSALTRAHQDFQQLGRTSASANREQQAYAGWIQQLTSRLVEDCRKVLQITTRPLPNDVPCKTILSTRSGPGQIDIRSEKSRSEVTGEMIEELNGSLGEFDEKLLREQERVKAKTPRATGHAGTGGGAAGAAGSNGGSGESDQDGNESENKAAAERSEGKDKAGDARQQSGQTDERGAPVAGNKEVSSKPGTGTTSSTPKDIPDGSDDDVVARQIREAAENETDPELKAKLWKEYKRYKEAIR